MGRQNGANWTAERLIGILRELAREKELPEHLEHGPILGADTVESLGIDSIGAVGLIDRMEAEAGVLLPDDFLGFDETVENIAKRMNSLS